MSAWYRHNKIEKVEWSCDGTVTLRFGNDNYRVANPGQFYMVSLDGVSENPVSASGSHSITIRDLGEKDEREGGKSFSHAAAQLKAGDTVRVRGPKGNGFRPDYSSEAHLIGGGCGNAPLRYLAEQMGARGSYVTALLGAKTKTSMLFANNIARFSNRFLACTDDGTLGEKGMVPEFSEAFGSGGTFYVCGPEKMMKAVAENLAASGVKPDHIQLLLERYMRCGDGLCSSCACGGKRVCIDGPMFTYDEILEDPLMLADFGNWKKDITGARVPL